MCYSEDWHDKDAGERTTILKPKTDFVRYHVCWA